MTDTINVESLSREELENIVLTQSEALKTLSMTVENVTRQLNESTLFIEELGNRLMRVREIVN